MNLVFVQKRGFNKRSFVLKQDKIIIENTTLGKINKYEVKLDQLGLDIHYLADNTLPGKIFLCVSLLFVILGISGLIFSLGSDPIIWCFNIFFGTVLSLIAYFRQHQDDIFLTGGDTTIVFYRNIPNEVAVLEFIEALRKQIKIYYKFKFAVIDENIPEQVFYGRINWLLDKEIISFDEFHNLKNQFEKQHLLSNSFLN